MSHCTRRISSTATASQKSAIAPSARGISSLIEPEVSSTTLSIQDSPLAARQHDVAALGAAARRPREGALARRDRLQPLLQRHLPRRAVEAAQRGDHLLLAPPAVAAAPFHRAHRLGERQRLRGRASRDRLGALGLLGRLVRETARARRSSSSTSPACRLCRRRAAALPADHAAAPSPARPRTPAASTACCRRCGASRARSARRISRARRACRDRPPECR